MKREDLFAAIGEVEDSRLQRLDAPSGVTQWEETNMKKQNGKTKRVLRNLLVAAVIVSMLTVTAFAATGYLIFDSPAEMLNTLFGNETGFDHSDGGIVPDAEGGPEAILVYPSFDREPVDETVMQEEVAPLVTPVGQSISWAGYTLTVDAYLYDTATDCGVLTYTLENPDGIPEYRLQTNGAVSFDGGDLVKINQWAYNYIVQDKTTPTKLTVACYFKRMEETNDVEVTFSPWAELREEEYDQVMAELLEQVKQEYLPEEAVEIIRREVENLWTEQDVSAEEREAAQNLTEEQWVEIAYSTLATEKFQERYTCPEKLSFSLTAAGEMSSITLGGGAATLSPIAMTLDAEQMEGFTNKFLSVAKIRFRDGSEYTVSEGITCNYVFAIGSGDMDVTYMFNRIVDVAQVAAVIVDGGIELPVD